MDALSLKALKISFFTIDLAIDLNQFTFYSVKAKSRIGFMTSMCLYHKNPVKFSFLQSLYGIQAQKGGGSDKLIKCGNELALNQSKPSIRKKISQLCKEQHTKLLQWKEKFTASVQHEVSNFI